MVRLKNRFIIAQVIENNGQSIVKNDLNFGSNDIHLLLKEQIKELFGDVGLGEIGQRTAVKYFDVKYSRLLLLKTTRDAESKVRFALSNVSRIRDQSITIRSLSVNSTPRTTLTSLNKLFEIFISTAVLCEKEKSAVETLLNEELERLEKDLV